MPEGKIVKALSGFYYVSTNGRIIQCRGRGVFRKRKVSPLVGDFVEFQAENDLEGYILAIEERKNELVRPPIANVDQAILVFSAARPEFSTALLDRFLVLIESKQIEPLICITKMDLLNEEEEAAIDGYAADYRSFGYEVILTSSENLATLAELRVHLEGKTSVFAGQSGVGKSSLLNALKPELSLKTDDISDSLGRGKHTTRHVELINVENGLVADTPGFSSLELTEIEAEDLPQYFPEMVERSHNCKFRGCLHINEPKCAVKAAVENGEIPSYRYEHYLQFMDEIKERKPRY
ncbi:ribosome small subunit-dependent GTPase A [Pseudobacillus badius]|uniref:ribosome small subunit-dependent GTPase A n=1 Tax=Bacillus badius TaxID=1455 RepID=UPI0007B05781|nr:ribosome small subunit-dependent GTPase A [Bacillus badius]KZO01625.1 ribosome small subunit-dependent GTPase A [Bacillus badius]MED0667274.1 ribosome small subunit-dependent GTPase A [Bacillus badius]OCS90019.1 ribosome small subunit-dependent GTPase A [Bacillus badius]OVE53545.1 ribosome small subunit-dependent GTPase A [Bacillus badius]TDW05909.1 ribosome biogenesis GTPase [Bacillus badius]